MRASVRIAILIGDIVHNSIDDRKRPLSGRTVVKVYDLMTVDLVSSIGKSLLIKSKFILSPWNPVSF